MHMSQNMLLLQTHPITGSMTHCSTYMDRCTWGCVDPAFPDGIMRYFQDRVYNFVPSGHVATKGQYMCSNMQCSNDLQWIQSWGVYIDEGCLGHALVRLCDHCYQQLDDWEKGHLCSEPSPATLPKAATLKKTKKTEKTA